MTSRPEKILVIKLSALGDFILALGAMEAIRQHHKKAHITLLTTKPFEELAKKSQYFDEIIIDKRPKFYNIPAWYSLFKVFNNGHFFRVYDLQFNDRTKTYYKLFLKKPEWSGVIPKNPLFYPNKNWRYMHAFKRHKEILKIAGINMEKPDISWMKSDIDVFNIKKPYILFIPGSAPTHLDKRWPAIRYGALGIKLIQEGYNIALLGTATEENVIKDIKKLCPEAIDLSAKTTLYDIARLAFDAAAAIGNDTGPTHIIALTGCPTIALFCEKESLPEYSSPIGKSVQCIQAESLKDVSMGVVEEALHKKIAA